MQITGLFDKMKNVFEKVVKILPAKVAMSQRDMKNAVTGVTKLYYQDEP